MVFRCHVSCILAAAAAASRDRKAFSVFHIVLCFPYLTDRPRIVHNMSLAITCCYSGFKMSFAITFLYFCKHSKLCCLLLHFHSIHSLFITCSFPHTIPYDTIAILLPYLLKRDKKLKYFFPYSLSNIARIATTIR